jgi:hypothetical protein
VAAAGPPSQEPTSTAPPADARIFGGGSPLTEIGEADVDRLWEHETEGGNEGAHEALDYISRKCRPQDDHLVLEARLMVNLIAGDEALEAEGSRIPKRKRDADPEESVPRKSPRTGSPTVPQPGSSTAKSSPSAPAATPIRAFPKADACEKDIAPSPSNFVHPKEWVALWITVDPAVTHQRKRLWEKDPYFAHLCPFLLQAGWTEQEFESQPESETCVYRGQNGEPCQTKYGGHVPRHMLSHLPQGIGYYFVCPVCKHASRRSDMSGERHTKSCKGWKGPSKQLRTMTKTNVFLR